MGAWGALIMGCFGTVFAALTMYWHWQVTGVALALPALVSAFVAGLALQTLRMPGSGISPSPAAERMITWSTIAEGVGLFLAANIVINLHRPALLLPAMALVVGLHFLPIAVAAAFRPFLWLGTALIAAAAVGFAAPAPLGGALAGLASAVALWTAAIMAIARDRRHRAASRSA